MGMKENKIGCQNIRWIVLAVSNLETDELDDEIFVPMYYTKENSNLYIVPFVKYIFAVRINCG